MLRPGRSRLQVVFNQQATAQRWALLLVAVACSLMLIGCEAERSTTGVTGFADEPLPSVAPAPSIVAVDRLKAEPAQAVSEILSVDVTRSPASSAKLALIGQDSVAKLALALDAIARASKRGDRAVSSRRIVLAALAAQSEADYRSELRKLPVVVVDSGAVHNGALGRFRNYQVNGKTRARRFFPEPSRGSHNEFADAGVVDPLGRAPVVALEGTTWSAFEDAVDSTNDLDGEHVPNSSAPVTSGVHLPPDQFASADGFALESTTICSAYYEQILYEGECASQADIDDALLVLAALDAEVQADSAEFVATCAGLEDEPLCIQEPYFDELELGNLDAEISSWSGDGAYETLEMEDGSEALFWNGSSPAGCDVPQHAVGPVRAPTGDCTTKAIAAGVSLLGWTAARFGAGYLLAAAAPPLGAVVAAMAGLGASAVGAGIAVATYLECPK